jgi:F-type H+-transporting ATPase subunit c
MINTTMLGVAGGLGFIMLSLSYGMSKIGEAAVIAVGRQPEASDKIQNVMVIPLAFLEGAGLFAIVVCLVIGYYQT